MRILLITATLAPHSGWGRYSSAIVNELKAQGHTVQIASEDISLTDPSLISLKKLTKKTALVGFIANCLTLRRVVAEKKVDVLHALDGWPYAVYAWVATIGTDTPFFSNGIGTYSVAPLYALISGFLLRRAYRAAKQIFCISRFTFEQLTKAGVSETNLCVIHMGSTPLLLVSKEEQERLRLIHDIPPTSSPIVLTVGAMKHRKGQFETLKAIALLKKKYPNILYVVAGSGNHSSYVAMLREYANKHDLVSNLKVMDDVNDETLAFLYSIASVFALNSLSDPQTHHFEGFGLVVIEAAQFGTPAVGSANSGVEDAIDDGKTGLLTTQGDVDDIAQNIDRILSHRDRYSGAAAKHYREFGWEKAVKSYVDWYTRFQ